MTVGASRFRWRPEHLHVLPVERARARVSAYVYGNILVLSAVVTATPEAVRNGHALVYVLGTTVTTFLAHVLAHDFASAVGAGAGFDHARHLRAELRDAVPILSSGSVPALLLLIGAVTDRRPVLLELVAAGVVITRLAGMGPVVARLSSAAVGDSEAPVPPQAVWAGVGLAVVSTLIVALKVWLLH